MQIEITKNCGLCGGCTSAINTVKKTLEYAKNVVIFKPIVHNEKVNSMLKALGAKIVEKIDDLKSTDTVIIRTHGEPKKVFDELDSRGIKYIDCTCPVVKKIHEKVENFSKNGYEIILIGKPNHPEVVATLGYSKNTPILISSMDGLHEINFDLNKKYYVVCQTTFNIFKAHEIFDELNKISKEKNVEIFIDNTLCNMQSLINSSSIEIAKNSNLVFVIGGENSSNSHELFENVKKYTKAVYLSDINDWKKCLKESDYALNNNMNIGITAGASTMKEDAVILKNMLLKEYENMAPTC